jgi:hypothetical protein
MVRRPLEDKRFFDVMHKWLKRRIPKPKLCELCNKIPPQDLANVTGTYDRNFSNWKYICKKCHWHLDEDAQHIPSTKGIKFSKETIEKMRQSHMGILKGRKQTEQTKKILSDAHKGTKLSQYHRMRISEAIREHWKTRI